MQFGSLFAGIGGIDLGLERAGMECIWQVENDEYCTRVLEKHWPEVPRYGDIHSIAELPTVDLVAGGFPCQPVSLASGNKRKGQEDERWLWPEFFRIVCLVRPRYVLVENTPGLLSLGWQDVLKDLAEGGFDAEWQTFPAAALGAPHRRERIFIVAYAERNSGRRVFEGAISTVPFWGTPDKGSRSRVPRIWDQEVEHGLRDANDLAYGFPQSVATRLPGNAVVPQVAQWIGERILEFDE